MECCDWLLRKCSPSNSTLTELVDGVGGDDDPAYIVLVCEVNSPPRLGCRLRARARISPTVHRSICHQLGVMTDLLGWPVRRQVLLACCNRSAKIRCKPAVAKVHYSPGPLLPQRKHLTVESYTAVIVLLTFILIIISIPSPLTPSFKA